MPGSPFEALDALASRLPFHLEDTDAANAAFVRWRSSGSDADRRIVQLWTYCFIRRYYTVKFVQDSGSGAADLDELIDKTFLKAEESSSEIKTPDRYTADRKSTRLNSSHVKISYAVLCLKKKKRQ